MAAVVVLTALDDRGEKILDELEEATDQRGERLEHDSRRYTLLSPQADMDAFDRMLDKIAPDWRDHVSRLPWR